MQAEISRNSEKKMTDRQKGIPRDKRQAWEGKMGRQENWKIREHEDTLGEIQR